MLPGHNPEHQISNGDVQWISFLSGFFSDAVSAIGLCSQNIFGNIVGIVQDNIILMILYWISKTAKAVFALMNFSEHVPVIQVVDFSHEIYTYILA